MTAACTSLRHGCRRQRIMAVYCSSSPAGHCAHSLIRQRVKHGTSSVPRCRSARGGRGTCRRPRLLVPPPPLLVRSVLLIGRQPAHLVSAENPVHQRPGYRELVKALRVVGDLAGPEMVVLPEVGILLTSLGVARGERWGRRGRSHRPASPCSAYRRCHCRRSDGKCRNAGRSEPRFAGSPLPTAPP